VAVPSPPTSLAGERTPDAPVWHTLPATEVAAGLGVDVGEGLSSSDVRERTERYGPNRLAEPPQRPRWKLFVDQFRSGIVLILVAAAVIAGLLGDVKDTVVIAVVLLINAVLGYVQEAKASNALAALEEMLVARVRLRRDGQVVEVATDDVVPGDVVLMEAGDRIPADGRFVLTANTSVDESSLTGESVAVEKDAASVAASDAALGDRLGIGFMNTTLVRGRAELVVTSTGMGTEMGKVAELLGSAEVGDTPLQRQLDKLSKRLAIIAGVAVALVLALQLIQGEDLGDAIIGAVALAVAAIPEGLPAVVTVTLAIGISRMAKQNAIVKRLHSVETLGSTSVICSDKTGTLTLNQMTARRFARGSAVYRVTGEGYSTVGEIHDEHGRVAEPGQFERAMLVAALCDDAVARDDDDGPGIVGDPTEAALVVLAAKTGIDAESTRRERPRLGEVPFDSAHKFMATFHRADPADPSSDVLICVKGAPDVLTGRAASFVDHDGVVRPLDPDAAAQLDESNNAIASGGMRVMAVATRQLPAADVLGADGTVADPDRWIEDLTFEALIGIVDPPRSEARDAIALCHSAGIQVKMITGDHAVTAGAIARELGVEGRVVTGDDLSAMSDEELAAQIDGIGVCARVSPEHKVRVVEALRSRGHIVAMTGDGVNDAAALRRADIGVAMGITGTEVTKEAGDMVLTDDNFATIVGAVERGRTIYDNIVKFVRFQLATNMGAISTILGASLFGLPVPFSPIQVLWVNLIADGPPAMTLGIDNPQPGIMDRAPIPGDAAILTTKRIAKLVFLGVVMAAGVLTMFVWARNEYGEDVALTMAFTAFVSQQMVNVFNSRTESGSVFCRYTFTNWRLWAVVGGVMVAQILATNWGPLQSLFGTEHLTWTQWGIALVVASTVLWVEELRKLGVRLMARRTDRTAEVTTR
jgi:Ca2+-transporting ATPase